MRRSLLFVHLYVYIIRNVHNKSVEFIKKSTRVLCRLIRNAIVN
jgi:hypothetical protein